MSPSSLVSEAGEPKKNENAPTARGSIATADNGKSSAKCTMHHPNLDVPRRNVFARSSDSISVSSLYSADNENERPPGRLRHIFGGNRLFSPSPAPLPRTWKQSVRSKWLANKGLALVTFAQLFGVSMSVTTRLLELDGNHGAGMHPFQVCPPRLCPSYTSVLWEMIDLVCTDDRHSDTESYLPMVSQG